MRLVALALAVTLASSLVGCTADEAKTSEFVTTASPTFSGLSGANPKVSALPAPSELKMEAMPAMKGGGLGGDSFASGTSANDDVPEWMKNCSAGMPCVPPEEVGPESNGGDSPSSVPDWMQDCSAGMPCVPPEEASEESSSDDFSDEVPAWMRECSAGMPCDYVRTIND